jgi:hypothetical protein
MAIPKSREELDALRDNFIATVDVGDEHAVQSFLEGHDHIFQAIMPYCRYIHREFRLGDEYRADFVLLGNSPNIIGIDVVLVELESPKCKLFTKTGDPTKELSHAMRQIRDWRAWIRNNRRYYLERLGKVFHHLLGHGRGFLGSLWGSIDNYGIVIGRRDELSDEQKEKLRALIQEDGHSVMTYDTLIERYCYMVEQYLC